MSEVTDAETRERILRAASRKLHFDHDVDLSEIVSNNNCIFSLFKLKFVVIHHK